MTVDYFSGFFEIDRLYDLRASTVIMKLYALMARYGIPDEVVSDSSSLCKSREFKAFAKEYGCKHMKKRPIATINLMVKLSLLSRKQRRSLRTLQQL